jgi:nucleotide-binding universal stress UspA family protein
MNQPVSGPAARPDLHSGGRHRLHIGGPGQPKLPATQLVVGYSDDPASRGALAVAADLAWRLSAHLHVAHVIDLDDYPIDPDSPSWEADAQATLADEQQQVESALAGRVESWTYHAARGVPARLLAALAEEHDALFVIVGTHGEGAGAMLVRMLRGRSVTHGLIGRNRRPVIVVPLDADAHLARIPGSVAARSR